MEEPAITLTAHLASGGTVSFTMKCNPAALTDAERELLCSMFERFLEPARKEPDLSTP